MTLAGTACSGGSSEHDLTLSNTPPTTVNAPTSTSAGATAPPGTPATGSTVGRTSSSVPASADVTVTIDAAKTGATISPDILGVSSTLTADQLHQAGLTVNSWGGNPATRYNYDIGHAWNNGADYEFRNTNFDTPAGDAAMGYVKGNKAAAVHTRMAIPTLGWVAKNDDPNTCSFPSGDGCLAASAVGDCKNPKETADPTRANVESTPAKVGAWLTRMAAAGATPDFVAMDNEPDLWGNTHFDVHPKCPTYEEILDKFTTYAAVVQAAMPGTPITGPTLCCWYDYWHIAPGPADGSNQEFVSWFLDKVRAHDEQTGQRSLAYLDVHFYPQSGVFNDKDDPQTDALRLRSTRALWDPNYTDESWINDKIQFIPRMRTAIADHYPGTKLFISEWNFGNDKKINGALAIADVLGIYGREGVDAAAYWRNPDVGSPGWFAFTMHGNYDGKGTRFGGTSVSVETTNDLDIGAYAAVDPASGLLRVMLVNRDPDSGHAVSLQPSGFHAAPEARRFTYAPSDLTKIVAGTASTADPIELPASSITVIELLPA
jgi:hypothetical protein